MKLSNLYESRLDDARTGQPFQTLAFRGQTGQQQDRARGIFYFDKVSHASEYGKHVVKTSLKFDNPLVVKSTAEALSQLTDAIKPKYVEYFEEHGAYGDPRAERLIAAAARKLGYDAIIYNGGLNEIVDLR